MKLKRLSLIGALLAAGCLSAQPARAWGWGYFPYLGSSLLYRSVFPGSYSFRGAGYNSGFYLLNSAVYAGAQGVASLGRQAYLRSYQNPSQLRPSQTRSQSGYLHPAVEDQIAAARWYKGQGLPSPGYGPGAAPAFVDPVFAAAEAGDPFITPVPSQAGSFAAAPSVVPPPAIVHSDTPPPLAPDVARAQQQSSSFQAPLAAAFVEHVNNKYDGHIASALKDKSTRGYAEALGIVDEKQRLRLGSDRVNLVKSILQDQNEDAVSKLNTVRMLLKH